MNWRGVCLALSWHSGGGLRQRGAQGKRVTASRILFLPHRVKGNLTVGNTNSAP
jgi:hypothetical protein